MMTEEEGRLKRRLTYTRLHGASSLHTQTTGMCFKRDEIRTESAEITFLRTSKDVGLFFQIKQ